ncbi:MAG: hypothetical protein ACRDQX_00920 [Pseudonocardiaceae bacterium]
MSAALAGVLREELRAAFEIHLESIVAAALERIESREIPVDELTERQRREDAMARLRVDGYTGSWEKMVRASFSRYVSESYFAAESATNGHMLTLEALRKGIDPKSLFAGPQHRAERWASEELKDWWRQHGRVTFEEYRAELLGQGRAAHNIRVARAVP